MAITKLARLVVMAVDLFSSEFLLPSQLLSDEEDILLVPESLKPFNLRKDSSCYYNKPWEPPSHAITESAFSSPGESELGSAETDSDKDEDYIAELTRQMAQYMPQDDDKNKHRNSPQSFEHFEKVFQFWLKILYIGDVFLLVSNKA